MTLLTAASVQWAERMTATPSTQGSLVWLSASSGCPSYKQACDRSASLQSGPQPVAVVVLELQSPMVPSQFALNAVFSRSSLGQPQPDKPPVFNAIFVLSCFLQAFRFSTV